MARYKSYSYEQLKILSICFEDQIIPGTFAFALNHIIDFELDLSNFDHRLKNDKTGATAYDPRILLKIILYAYSLGITSSRKIEDLCLSNINFMALSADSRPHFTTIAGFVSKLVDDISNIFKQVLLICDDMGLISRDMFSIDGCKLPSNASKEWSGTRADFERKKNKMEKVISRILYKHKKEDENSSSCIQDSLKEKEKRQVESLKKRSRKIKQWLRENKDKKGVNNTPIKSNITDNDSAKIKTSKGVIQGYNGVTAVDSKHQVITYAQAFGCASEQHLLQPMLEGVRQNFQEIGKEEDILKDIKLSADNGFCNAGNITYVYENGIDAYLPDTLFRKRDPVFSSAKRHKKISSKSGANRFSSADFVVDPIQKTCICPAGKQMWLKCANARLKRGGYKSIQFKARVKDCRNCAFRAKCLKNIDQKEPRSHSYFMGKSPESRKLSERMKEKVDSDEGRAQYSRRLGIVEPVYANIVSNHGLNRFSLRGKKKVNAQWLLYCLVHNIGKICSYGTIAS